VILVKKPLEPPALSFRPSAPQLISCMHCDFAPEHCCVAQLMSYKTRQSCMYAFPFATYTAANRAISVLEALPLLCKVCIGLSPIHDR